MKFAVVEYTSKSGTIWRHTDAKPNYLADPDKEIDATSFGCYVSALKGEHIPLKGFIIGPDSHISTPQRTLRKIIKRLRGQFPPTYDISYFLQFDALLVVHQVSDTREMVTLLRRLRRHEKRPRVIGVPTQPFGILKVHIATHPQALQDLRDFMACCDKFVVVVKSTKDAWEELTGMPVQYLHQPYPVQYATTFYQPRSAKKPIIFVAGITDRPDIARGQTVAKELQRQFPQYDIHITDTLDVTQNVRNLAGARYTAMPFLPWQQQLIYLSQVTLVVNTDYTQTRGRVQVDCAAVGTPSIGADSDGQVDLYSGLPATLTTPTSTYIEQGKKLLTDEKYYDHITQTATEKLAAYTYEICADRLTEIINQIK